MARAQSDQRLLGSVLDRLLDREASTSRRRSLTELRSAVRRDLEDLLNCRQRCLSPPAGLDELPSSILDYGIPDVASVDPTNEEARDAFCERIERVLRRYEPRFRSIKVKVLENVDGLDRTLRFRMEAILQTNNGPESVAMDTHLDPVTRNFSVLADGKDPR